MVAEMILAPERLVANITFVRPLVGVSALVDEQVVRLGELPTTKATDEFCLFFVSGVGERREEI